MSEAVSKTSDDIAQEEILQAAIQLYRKFGPNKVTMDDVATATGRSRTSLYYYFKNRDEIFQAVLGKLVKGVAGDIRSAMDAAGTLNEKIAAFCMAKFKTTSYWKSIFSAMEASISADDKTKHTRMMDALHKKLMHQESIILNEVIMEAAAKKQVRAIAPEELDTLAFIISSSVRGIRREVYDYSDPHELTTAVQLLTAMVIKWLGE